MTTDPTYPASHLSVSSSSPLTASSDDVVVVMTSDDNQQQPSSSPSIALRSVLPVPRASTSQEPDPTPSDPLPGPSPTTSSKRKVKLPARYSDDWNELDSPTAATLAAIRTETKSDPQRVYASESAALALSQMGRAVENEGAQEEENSLRDDSADTELTLERGGLGLVPRRRGKGKAKAKGGRDGNGVEEESMSISEARQEAVRLSQIVAIETPTISTLYPTLLSFRLSIMAYAIQNGFAVSVAVNARMPNKDQEMQMRCSAWPKPHPHCNWSVRVRRSHDGGSDSMGEIKVTQIDYEHNHECGEEYLPAWVRARVPLLLESGTPKSSPRGRPRKRKSTVSEALAEEADVEELLPIVTTKSPKIRAGKDGFVSGVEARRKGIALAQTELIPLPQIDNVFATLNEFRYISIAAAAQQSYSVKSTQHVYADHALNGRATLSMRCSQYTSEPRCRFFIKGSEMGAKGGEFRVEGGNWEHTHEIGDKRVLPSTGIAGDTSAQDETDGPELDLPLAAEDVSSAARTRAVMDDDGLDEMYFSDASGDISTQSSMQVAQVLRLASSNPDSNPLPDNPLLVPPPDTEIAESTVEDDPAAVHSVEEGSIEELDKEDDMIVEDQPRPNIVEADGAVEPDPDVIVGHGEMEQRISTNLDEDEDELEEAGDAASPSEELQRLASSDAVLQQPDEDIPPQASTPDIVPDVPLTDSAGAIPFDDKAAGSSATSAPAAQPGPELASLDVPLPSPNGASVDPPPVDDDSHLPAVDSIWSSADACADVICRHSGMTRAFLRVVWSRPPAYHIGCTLLGSPRQLVTGACPMKVKLMPHSAETGTIRVSQIEYNHSLHCPFVIPGAELPSFSGSTSPSTSLLENGKNPVKKRGRLSGSTSPSKRRRLTIGGAGSEEPGDEEWSPNNRRTSAPSARARLPLASTSSSSTLPVQMPQQSQLTASVTVESNNESDVKPAVLLSNGATAVFPSGSALAPSGPSSVCDFSHTTFEASLPPSYVELQAAPTPSHGLAQLRTVLEALSPHSRLATYAESFQRVGFRDGRDLLSIISNVHFVKKGGEVPEKLLKLGVPAMEILYLANGAKELVARMEEEEGTALAGGSWAV